MDRITPFHIRRVDSSQLIVQRASAARNHSKIHVNLLVHERQIQGFSGLRASTRLSIESEMIRDTKPYLAEEFVRLLRFAAHPASFFPGELLSAYPERTYYLLLQRTVAHQVLRLLGQDASRSRMIPLPEGYHVQIVIGPVIREEAYLVAQDKYTVFLRPKRLEDAIRIYRSDFVDLQQRTPPPMAFHSEDIYEAIEETLQIDRDEGSSIASASDVLTKCPLCGGPVQHLGQDDYFCLECDWDNLTPIHGNRPGVSS